MSCHWQQAVTMSGLPLGWELDYDGKRWFYTYKPTGHIQYHFPSEGDEFPEFVDTASPAPRLAPEERLESQQQMRRRTSDRQPDAERWRSRMSATARPVSDVWESDAPGAREVFQPESFMYLGPGAYADVSPLMEDEEEAARRTVVGGVVSAEGSAGATPVVREGEISPPMAITHVELASDEVQSPAAVIPALLTPEAGGEPVVHMLDSREMPHELPVEERFNPVGIMAEMATSETGPARVETHPDPVEMGDNRILAPIETEVPPGIAELPEQSSPVESKQAEKVMGKSQKQEPKPNPVQVGDQSFNIARKPSSAGSRHQPYLPGQHTDEQPRTSGEWSSNRSSMQREVSCMMGTRPTSGKSTPEVPSTEETVISQKERGLTSIPSVLKPARNKHHRSSVQGIPHSSAEQHSTASPSRNDTMTGQDTPGVSKVPSVLKPARGRAPSQPTKPPATPTNIEVPPRNSDEGNTRSDEIRPMVSATLLPSRPHNQGQIPAIPEKSELQQPARPASAMPVLPSNPPSQEYVSMPEPHHHLPVRRAFKPPPSHVHRPASTPAFGIVLGHTPSPHAPGQSFSALAVPRPSKEEMLLASPSLPGKISPLAPTAPLAGSGEVSPLRSRSESLSSGLPTQTPSPLENMRRGSSAISLAQSPDGTPTFTPSPESLTPGSQADRVTSPPSRPSRLRNSVSGSLPVQVSSIEVTSPNPPVPHKIPLEQDQASYFPRQHKAGPEQTQIHERPVTEARSLSLPVQKTPSTGPVPPPKVPEEHAQSFFEGTKTFPSEAPAQSAPKQTHTVPGHVLVRIEEKEETPTHAVPVHTDATLPTKRHTVASSTQPQPPPNTQPATAGSVMGRVPGPPAPLLQQSPSPYHHQMPPQGHQFPGAYPPTDPSIPPAGYPMPGQQKYWSPPDAPPIITQGFRPSSVPPEATASPATKEKKWAKWFKGPKSPKSAQSPSPQAPMPIPGQIPPPGVQAPPPAGWAPGPYAQPAVWQPGQPTLGQPLPGSQPLQAPPPGHVLWQPPAGVPGQGPAPTSQGIPSTPIYKIDTAGSTPTSGTGPSNARPRQSTESQQSYRALAQPYAPAPQPLSHPATVPGPLTAASLQNSKPAHPQHAHMSPLPSMAPVQATSQPARPLQGDAALVPMPLFSKPVSPLSTHSSVAPPGVSASSSVSQGGRGSPSDKWAKRPAADYSGGDWGDDEDWH